MKASEIALKVGARYFLPRQDMVDPEISDISPIHTAQPGEISFLTNPKYADWLYKTAASAVIVAKDIPDLGKPQLVHQNPYAVMAKTSQIFRPQPEHLPPQDHQQAWIHSGANVDPSCRIGPFAVIENGACIGKNVMIHAGAYIGPNAVIGDDTVIFPNSVIMAGCQVGKGCIIHANSTIGADGFGFAPTADGIEKIIQRGKVVIEDEVELGSSCSIDRGAFEDTVIGRGTKIDSHVHVGHGSEVGEYSMLCGMVGIAGSAKIGKRFIAAGQSGVGPGVTIGNGVTIGAKAGATRSIPDAGEYMGLPAIPSAKYWRGAVSSGNAEALAKTVRELQRKVQGLEKALGQGPPPGSGG